MLSLAGTLGDQLGQGFELGGATDAFQDVRDVRHIVVCGMGGSGVTGDVLSAAWSGMGQVPMVTAKGYALPFFCGPDTLVLAVSYSGNTEETLAAYHEAVGRSCNVVAIASGGRLEAAAREDGVPVVVVPSEVLAPRAALGYLVGAALGVFEAIGAALTGAEGARAAVEVSQRTLDPLAARLEPARPLEENPAKQVAAWLQDATPLVWGTEGVSEAAAVRWKTQLNENAKVPAFWSVIPELDHNEVEGWSGEEAQSHRIVVLRSGTEPSRLGVRVPATLEAMASVGLEAREVWAEGSTPLEQVLALIMVGDFVSIYLAILRGVDPTPIPTLTALKERRAALGTLE